MITINWRHRPMRFVTDQDGCFLCTSHAVHPKGYLKKTWGSTRAGHTAVTELFHRFVFRVHYGPIPEGYEIHHSCHKRGCCNPKHLECIEGSKHARMPRTGFVTDRREKAKAYWKATGCTGVHLAKTFGVKQPSASQWIIKWRNDEANVTV